MTVPCMLANPLQIEYKPHTAIVKVHNLNNQNFKFQLELAGTIDPSTR